MLSTLTSVRECLMKADVLCSAQSSSGSSSVMLLLILVVSLLLGSKRYVSQFLERGRSLLEGLSLWICAPPLVKAVHAAIFLLMTFI